MIDNRETHTFKRESSGSDSDEADLAPLRKKASDVAANTESITFDPLKRETSSSGIDEVDHPIFGGIIGYGDVGSPMNTGSMTCTVVEDAEEADIQRLVNGLRAAKNNKNTMRLISQGENAALQSTFMNQTSSITRNTAEQSRKRKGAPSAAERLQKKRLTTATQPTATAKLARSLSAVKASNQAPSGSKISLERMRADLKCMNPRGGGGDEEEIVEALDGLLEAAREAVARFRGGEGL